jgi:hypothetical protein
MKKQVVYLQKLFYDLWNDFGSVYLLVQHSERTTIGKRGFTDDEKQRGLVLVFNNKTNTELNWSAEGDLTCVLAFGGRKEDVHIHHDDLRAVFSPEAKVQYMRNDAEGEKTAATPGPEQASPGPTAAPDPDNPQVVSLEKFRKRKKE